MSCQDEGSVIVWDNVKGNNVKIWALLRLQEKLCSMGQQHGGLLPIFETFASLSVPITELDACFSQGIRLIVSQLKELESWVLQSRRRKFFALWQKNLPDCSEAKCVVHKVFKGKLFHGGKVIRILQEMLSAALWSWGRNSTI